MHSGRGEWARSEAPQVAPAAEQMPLQGVAAASFLPAQLEPAILQKIKHNLNPSKQETTSSPKDVVVVVVVVGDRVSL